MMRMITKIFEKAAIAAIYATGILVILLQLRSIAV